MQENFWQTQTKPFYALAPMEDVTDTVFREIIAGISDPSCLNLYMTEFVSTDGLCHDIARDRVIHRLIRKDSERELHRKNGAKLVAQIWGTNPERYQQAIKEVLNEMDFDGIDINMGCPVAKVVKKGSCSGLINTPSLAKEIILAAKEVSNVPVSVKTRIGVEEVVTEEWINHLIDAEPAAITLHGRMQIQMSDGLADWNEIEKARKVRDQRGVNIPLIGNGDVKSMVEADKRIADHNLDGVMVGRGIFHNPWLFNREQTEHGPKERLALLWKHASNYHDMWEGTKHFLILRRFFKIYAQGFEGASTLRGEIMSTKGLSEVEEILKRYEFL